ncbi:Transcription factor 25 [Boothiomyces macroporosus]|uniref:Transcription factor 25 n=1 Tax=Boothiomyces macroporosus TaxID=261099 RepID=A0AAD5Y576_9FUNG|nr:Transcription factor 25 [Boothiomyces macroporosus]
MRSFRKLNKNELQQEESEEEILDDDTVHNEEPNEIPQAEESNPAPRKSRKKKKSKKPSTPVEEDIDSIINEINEKYGKVESVQQQKDFANIWKLDIRNLDFNSEMKRKFGSAVEAKKTGRKKYIVAPKLSWPKDTSLVNMELIERDPLTDVKQFTLIHSRDYQSLQFQFYNAIETHDPNAIFYILEQYPYHFSALLQMSEVCKQNGDIDTAFEYVEKCVYAFEKSLGSSFKLDGKARLNYDRVENRPVYFALFKYIQFLSRKENMYFTWKVPELQNWLKTTAQKVFEDYKNSRLSCTDELSSLKDYYDSRNALPLNCQRIVILSDALNLIPFIPKGAMDNLLAFDPFPPESAINGPYESIYLSNAKSNSSASIIEQLGGWFGRIGNSLFGQDE